MTREQLANAKGKFYVHLRGKDQAIIDIIDDVHFLNSVDLDGHNISFAISDRSQTTAQIFYRNTSSVVFSIEKVRFCNVFNTLDEAKLYIELNNCKDVTPTEYVQKVADPVEEIIF